MVAYAIRLKGTRLYACMVSGRLSGLGSVADASLYGSKKDAALDVIDNTFEEIWPVEVEPMDDKSGHAFMESEQSNEAATEPAATRYKILADKRVNRIFDGIVDRPEEEKTAKAAVKTPVPRDTSDTSKRKAGLVKRGKNAKASDDA